MAFRSTGTATRPLPASSRADHSRNARASFVPLEAHRVARAVRARPGGMPASNSILPIRAVEWRIGALTATRRRLGGKHMRSKPRRLRTMIAAVGLLLASAATQPAFAQTAEKLTVRFTWKFKGEYAPLFLALDK